MVMWIVSICEEEAIEEGIVGPYIYARKESKRVQKSGLEASASAFVPS
jgi:hypothetical protein